MRINHTDSHVLLLDAKQKRLNAGPKARLDTAIFLNQIGFRIQVVPTTSSRYLQKITAALIDSKYKKLISNLLGIKRFSGNEIVWCQFPVTQSTQAILNMAKSGNCRTVAFIHDIEGLKFSPPNWEMVKMEAAQLRNFSQVVSLNPTIAKILNDNGVEVTVSLNCWDYVIINYDQPKIINVINKRIIFAGNLAENKAGFVYKLGILKSIRFDLYGEGLLLHKIKAVNTRYLNRFTPDNPPFQADGALGLIWDGPELDSCCGDFGAYLAFNTPHKTSMYLARGLPVIVWNGAAIAPLIATYNAGILISSLHELESIVHALSNARYSQMRLGAESLGKKIRAGFFIKAAANEVRKSFGSEIL